MWQLNLPEYKFKIIQKAEKLQIFDSVRKKYVALTPEEWVRQNFIQYIISSGKYPISSIVIEKQLKINGLNKRYDAIIYDSDFNPRIILEFKAPKIELTQSVFDQVSTYNMKLKVDFFIISNGIEHHICKVDWANSRFIFLEELPDL
jgi:hypothetical protein